METLPVPTEDPKEPGADLTPIQRQLIELMATEGISALEAANRCEVPSSNVYYWRKTEPWRRYYSYLVSEAVHDSVLRSRAILAAGLPTTARRNVEYAQGTAAPGPYQDKFMRLMYDNVVGRPSQAQGELGVQVPTDKGPITIVWRARRD